MPLFKFIFIIFLLILSVCNNSYARVFDIKNERFASYFKYTIGPSAVQKKAYEDSGGSSLTYSGSARFNYSGEWGFVYTTPYLSFKLAFEGIKPEPLEDLEAKDANGTLMYNLNSSITAFTPKFGVEANIRTWDNSRLILGVAAGSSTVTLNNEYTFSTDGLTTYSPLTDFREDGKSVLLLYEASLAWEGLMTDTTTIIFEVGYRMLNITKMSHNTDSTTFQGSVIKGADITNTDGSARTFDMTGTFAGISFRFYL